MHQTDRSHRGLETCLLVALPCAVVLLSVIVWITGVSRSGFWADDFLNVTHFARSLGNLSDDHINAGKYVINIFWAIGTEAFGEGSVVPFLLLNSLVFATGLILWLWIGAKTRWGIVGAWWIGGLFIATAAWYPTALWSSNITHSGGFLALGVGALAHSRSMGTRTVRGTVRWSVVSGVAWTFAIMSNLLYIGLMPIAAYCAWYQISKLRRLGMETSKAAVIVSFWNLLLPIIYFVTVAYPGTTTHQGYTVTGLRFVHENLRFYRLLLAPTSLLIAVYAALLIGTLVGVLISLRRREVFPVVLLSAAGATALPALVQSQQRDIHYMAMPLLLLFSALAAGACPTFLRQSRRLKSLARLAAVTALLLLFRQGTDIRAYFVQTPYGSSLAAFRTDVASLTPEGGVICVRLNLDASHQAFLIAAMSGEDGFLVPPISAAQAYFVTGAKRCSTNSVAIHITVSLNGRGEFIASG
jgi:hypothetical protein